MTGVKWMFWRVGKWGAGGALLAGIVWWNWDELVRATQQEFTWIYLLFSGLICLAALFLTFFRWFLLVRAQNLPFREVDALRLGFIGYFFNLVLPGSVTGDLVKAGLLAREQHRRTVAIATIIVDRVVGLFGLLLLVSVIGAFFWDRVRDTAALRVILIFVWCVTAGFALTLLILEILPRRTRRIVDRLVRIPRVGPILGEIAYALRMYRRQLRYLAISLALAVLGHAGFVLSFYFSARSVPEPTPSLDMHYLIIPVGMVIQAVPLTPGNLGVNEGAFQSLYQLVDSSLTVKGMLVSVAQRLVTWCVSLVGLGLYIPLRRTVREVLEAPSPPSHFVPSPPYEGGVGGVGEQEETERLLSQPPLPPLRKGGTIGIGDEGEAAS